MADHFQTIYAQHADQYDAMVEREDVEGNLPAAIQSIAALAGRHVVELGAGTGRVTRLVAPHAKSIHAFDGSAHMLDVARGHLEKSGLSNWKLGVAENNHIPLADGCADVVVEGWSFGHLTGWYPDDWRSRLAEVMGEVRRLARPGGTILLIETLGTGFETPHVVTDGLGALFAVLAWEYGCQSKWIRTDYTFESVDEAERMARFFFGDGLGDRVRREQISRLPECTGLWWLTVE